MQSLSGICVVFKRFLSKLKKSAQGVNKNLTTHRKQAVTAAPVPPSQSEKSDAPAPGVAQVAQPAPVITKNKLVQEWTDTKQTGQGAAQAQAITPEIDDTDDWIDPIEQFLIDLDMQQGYSLRVDRLKNFSKDGQSGQRSPKDYCFTYQFDINSYLQSIADDFGAGSYWLTLRHMDGRIAKCWTEHIAARPAKQQPGQLASTQPAPGSPPQSPIAVLREYSGIAKELSSIRASMGWEAPPASQNAGPVAAAPPLEERLITKLLERAIDSGDDSALERMMGLYFPKAESKENDSMSMIMQIIERVAAPFIPAILASLQQAPQAPPPAAAPRGPARAIPFTHPAPDPRAPAERRATRPERAAFSIVTPAAPPALSDLEQDLEQDLQPDNETAMAYDKLYALLDDLVQDLTEQSKLPEISPPLIDHGAGLIVAFRKDVPMLSMFLDGLVNGQAQSCLSSLELFDAENYKGISSLPLALNYIEALQKRVKILLKGDRKK